jgi:hypothetical protein
MYCGTSQYLLPSHRLPEKQPWFRRYVLPVRMDMAASTRTNGRVHPDSRVFLGCGYCTTGGARDFALFPEVVWADVTSDTNNTGNFLLTYFVQDI